jgi:hypothetical protein
MDSTDTLKPVFFVGSTRLTPSDIRSLHADKRATTARLKELQAQRKAAA